MSISPQQENPTILPARLHLTAHQWDAMRQHVESTSPEEACGLVAGGMQRDDYRATAILPVTNILHSPTRYQMAPQEQLRAFEEIESQGLEVVAIFHSHPQGPDEPSPTDIAEAYYPQAVYLIWSKRTGEWRCRGFSIFRGLVKPVVLQIDG